MRNILSRNKDERERERESATATQLECKACVRPLAVPYVTRLYVCVLLRQQQQLRLSLTKEHQQHLKNVVMRVIHTLQL